VPEAGIVLADAVALARIEAAGAGLVAGTVRGNDAEGLERGTKKGFNPPNFDLEMLRGVRRDLGKGEKLTVLGCSYCCCSWVS
jgi:hypothetical protein